jgi:hypothetical protein
VHTRPELWQRAVARLAAAGGQDWRLAPSVRDGLSRFGVDLVERPERKVVINKALYDELAASGGSPAAEHAPAPAG